MNSSLIAFTLTLNDYLYLHGAVMSSLSEKKTSISHAEILADNLKFLMHAKKIDAAELNKRTGIALTTINGLRRGDGNPTMTTLAVLAELFQVSIGQLTEARLSDNDQYVDNSMIKSIPVVTFAEFNNFIADKKHYKTSLITSLEPYQADYCYGVKLTNNSMTPFFEKGCIFIVTTNTPVNDGDLVLVQFDENTICVRKIYLEGNDYFFQSMVNNAEGRIIKGDKFKIHGVVIKTIQNYHE